MKDKKEKYQKDAKQMRALTKLYMPLDSAKLAETLQGVVSLQQDGTDEDAVVIDSYAKQGDQLSVTVNHTTAKIERVSVKSYFDEPDDVLTSEVIIPSRQSSMFPLDVKI